MNDELLKKIREDYAEFSKHNKYIQELKEKFKNGKATFAEVDSITKATGYELKVAISKNISENLSDFADEETIKAILNNTLGDNYEMINSIASNVQERLDETAGISIKPKKAKFPQERVNNLAKKTASTDLTKQTAVSEFGASVENLNNSFFTDYIKENADFRSRAGLRVYIIRSDDSGCCDWCRNLVGKFVYPDVPSDIWRRHKRCSCEIIYVNERAGTYDRVKFSDYKDHDNHDKIASQKQVTRLTPAQAKAKEREIMEKNPLTFGRKSDIIKMNQSKSLDIFNDYDISTNSPITAQQIIDELGKSDIGKQTLKDIENLPKRIKLSSEIRYDGVRGEEFGGAITIYLSNCENPYWAARTVIHECTHQKYGIGNSQWAECVCIAQELKHARNRNFLTYSEKKTIVKAVKEAYPEYNWRRGGLVNGKRKK